MTNSTNKLDDLFEGYTVIDTTHLYHHEHDEGKLKQAIEAYIAEREQTAIKNYLKLQGEAKYD